MIGPALGVIGEILASTGRHFGGRDNLNMMDDTVWDAWRRISATIYNDTNRSASLQGRIQGRKHAVLERNFLEATAFPRFLDVGAGTGEHFQHDRHRFEEYVMTDLDKAMLTRARKKCPADLRLRFVAADAAKLPVCDDYFDRLSSGQHP